ncbi:MAG: hypothetical protein WEA84_12080 [Rhodovibrionaceae bacterium]
MVETILDEDGKTSRFIVVQGDSCKEARDWTDGGLRYTPISAENNLVRHQALLLPSAVGTYGTEAELLESIAAYVARYVNLPEADRHIVGAYVLLSWVFDAFNELPYLRFKGDYGTGKSRALIVVGSLCQKPFFASGASTVSPIFHTLDAFGTTLILDEADFRFTDEKSELVKILNNGNVKGFPVLRTHVTETREFNPRAFTVFGPKIVAMRGEYQDAALESRFVTITMAPGDVEGIPINLPKDQTTEARKLRNQLLAYRLRHRHHTAIAADLGDTALEARSRQILAPLLSVAPTGEARRAILSRAHEHTARTYTERRGTIEGLVLGILKESLAAPDQDGVTVGNLAKALEHQHGDEIDRPATSRYVGGVLKRLGIAVYRRHGVFVIASRQEELLATLYKRFGISDEDTEPEARLTG